MDKEEIEIETNAEDLEHQGEEPEGAHEAGGEVDPCSGLGIEVEVSIGGEPDPQAEEERKAPQWVRDLRKQNRELARQNRELEQRIAKPAEAIPADPGKKPTIEDFDYDAGKFESALTQWFEKKNRADQEQQRRKAEAKAQEDAWTATLGQYEKLKAELKVGDFQEAELETQNALSVVQQGIVVQGAKNPALAGFFPIA